MPNYVDRDALRDALYDADAVTMKGVEIINSFPTADVPSALWTDDPISGTEFMTHNQGQSGFEIHFRTDDKAKYEAVQDECRRQIDHAKPAADVRHVVMDCHKCPYKPLCHDLPIDMSCDDVLNYARWRKADV